MGSSRKLLITMEKSVRRKVHPSTSRGIQSLTSCERVESDQHHESRPPSLYETRKISIRARGTNFRSDQRTARGVRTPARDLMAVREKDPVAGYAEKKDPIMLGKRRMVSKFPGSQKANSDFCSLGDTHCAELL